MNFPNFSSIVSAPFDYFTLPTSRTFLLYLATSFLIAVFAHVWHARDAQDRNGSLLSYLLPREVYTHPSSLVDYVYFVSNTMLYAVILVPFSGVGLYVSKHVVQLFSLVAQPVELVSVGSLSATIVYSLLVALVADFGLFLAHFLMHRSRLLWEFHKVHHSAEVMTPLTVYRMHPLDDMITLVIVGVLVGVTDAMVRFFVTPSPSEYVLYGMGALTFLFYLFGYNLRHSHIWVSYGAVVSRIFISPAQHQIHHSKAREHWDRNFGFILAIWDWLFGTLYVPRGYEKLTFGIGNGEERDYSSPLRLYIVPFRKALRALRKAGSK